MATKKKIATKALPQKGKRSATLDKSTAPAAPAAKTEAKAKKRAAAAQSATAPAAADKAKSVKLDDLSKALHSMTVPTVVGPLTWDKKGDVTDPKYVFYIWKNGTYAEM